MHSYTLLAEWHQTPLISLAQETVADHQPPAKHLGIALGSPRGAETPQSHHPGLNPQGGTSGSRLAFQATWQHWETPIPFKMLPEVFLHSQGQGFSQSWSGSQGWTLHIIPHGMLPAREAGVPT